MFAVIDRAATESGSARTLTSINTWSCRRNRPFVTLNCAAIPLGLLDTVRKNQLRCDPHQATRSPSRLPRKS
jgi:transcriptional regulator of acetoin/glycerol metabolism